VVCLVLVEGVQVVAARTHAVVPVGARPWILAKMGVTDANFSNVWSGCLNRMLGPLRSCTSFSL
jgi:Na+/alanine symporter